MEGLLVVWHIELDTIREKRHVPSNALSRYDGFPGNARNKLHRRV